MCFLECVIPDHSLLQCKIVVVFLNIFLILDVNKEVKKYVLTFLTPCLENHEPSSVCAASRV